MNDILKAAGIAAATIVGMYAGGVVCAIATNAIIKRRRSRSSSLRLRLPADQKIGEGSIPSFIF